MSRAALLAAMRRDAEQQLAALAEQAEAEITALTERTEAQLRQLRADEEQRRQAAAAQKRQTLLAQGQQRALAERLAGEERLQRRLWEWAEQLLADLAEEAPARLLATLAQELPPGEWQRVTVHPRDLATVRRIFPSASIADDAAIVGGLRVATAQGRIVVDNTLKTRLKHGWPELLPRLLRALEIDDAAAPG